MIRIRIVARVCATVCIYNIHDLTHIMFELIHRNSDQPTPNHGETSVRLVHLVQAGCSKGWDRGCHNQKTLARDNPRLGPPAVHHKRGFHTTHAVCILYLLLQGSIKDPRHIIISLGHARFVSLLISLTR